MLPENMKEVDNLPFKIYFQEDLELLKDWELPFH